MQGAQLYAIDDMSSAELELFPFKKKGKCSIHPEPQLLKTIGICLTQMFLYQHY